MRTVSSLVDREPRLAGEVEDDRGVEVAGAGAHDQALERGHAHRGLDRLASVDRARRGAVAEVEHDGLEVGAATAEERGGRLRDELVRRAVEAVAADAVLVGEIGGDRVRGRLRGDRVVEGRVEDRDVRDVGEGLLRGLDALEVRRVVQRGEVGEVLDVDLDEVGDERRLVEALAAVDDAVSDRDGRELVEARSVLGEGADHRVEAGGVVGDRGLELDALAVAAVLGATGLLPMRSTRPLASVSSVVISMSWYLNDDEPLLTTRTTDTMGLLG